MSERKRLFLKIFKAELEDCLEDVAALAAYYEKRYRADEIGDYVRNENRALLNRELDGLRRLSAELESFDPTAYPDVAELAAAVDDELRRRTSADEEPEAVYGIAKRKLQKVLRYVANGAT